MVGSTISHYRILERLGVGGMGEVWLAEDTKLGRKVAIKLLAAHLVSDDDVQKRFEREAKAAAGLSHPNICTVFEIDTADGKPFLATEYVRGESLEAKVECGPLPLAEALDIAGQIAEGLQTAHRGGVVHRDVKPGNILVTPEGRVKILDFGLALLTEGSKLTQLDTTVGTAAYMSPEQAQGREVDHRTDVWALGCVLYEMVAGQRPFKGQYDQALLYEVVNEEPEALTGLRSGVPMDLELAVNKCLEKDRVKRYQDVGELSVDLDRAASSSRSIRAVPVVQGATAPAGKSRLVWALSGLLAVALAALGLMFMRDAPNGADDAVRRFAFEIGSRLRHAVISPDGSRFAYAMQGAAGASLIVRSLSEDEPVEVFNDGVCACSGPSWSPDSRSLAFDYAGALQTIAPGMGPLVEVAKLPGVLAGAAWSVNGESIVFGSAGGIQEVSGRGGDQRQLLQIGDEAGNGIRRFVQSPHVAAKGNGDQVVFYSAGMSIYDGNLVAFDVKSGRRVVVTPGNHPFWSTTGHLLYEQPSTDAGIWALPFSLESLQATGEPIALAQRAGQPSVADDGTLLYIDRQAGWRLVIRDLDGAKLRELDIPRYVIDDPSFSPDGGRIVFAAGESNGRDIWLVETVTGNVERVTTGSDVKGYPVWSPDGETITYISNTAEGVGLYEVSARGGGTGRLLRLGELHPDQWDPTGEYLLGHRHGGTDLVALRRGELKGTFETTPVTQTPHSEDFPYISPDGGYVAYRSNKSGVAEVYVRRFPQSGDREWKVSLNGGTWPVWRGDVLFYFEGDSIVAASVKTGSEFEVVRRTPLFDVSVYAGTSRQRYDVSPDGTQIVLAEPVEKGTPRAIRIVQNWQKAYLD